VDADKRWMQEWALRKRRTRDWRLPDAPGPWDWVRAGAYEHFGHHRAGWIGWTFLAALLGVAMMLWVGFSTSAPETRGSVGVAMVGFAGAFYGTLNACTLRWGWAYPLTRAQRAEVAYRASLLYNLAFVVVSTPVVFVTKALLTRFIPTHPLSVPDELLAFALLCTAALLPGLQWMRLRHMANCGEGAQKAFVATGSMAAFTVLVGMAVSLYALTPLGKAPWLVLPSTLSLIALTQFWLRRQLRRFFRRADLI